MVTTRLPKTIVKPTALGPVANTDTKLLIYGLFQKGRVLAQDEVRPFHSRTRWVPAETDPAGAAAPLPGVPFTMAARVAPGCSRKPAMGPALAFVQENAAQENARERAWRSSPKGLLPDPPQAGEVQTVQNDVPANPCILRHHRTFALVLDKVQSNEGLPGAQSAARSSPGSRFEPAVRTPGGPVARHPQPRGRKSALRRERPSLLRGFQGRLSC